MMSDLKNIDFSWRFSVAFGLYLLRRLQAYSCTILCIIRYYRQHFPSSSGTMFILNIQCYGLNELKCLMRFNYHVFYLWRLTFLLNHFTYSIGQFIDPFSFSMRSFLSKMFFILVSNCKGNFDTDPFLPRVFSEMFNLVSLLNK